MLAGEFIHADRMVQKPTKGVKFEKKSLKQKEKKEYRSEKGNQMQKKISRLATKEKDNEKRKMIVFICPLKVAYHPRILQGQ